VYLLPQSNLEGIPGRLANGWRLSTIVTWQGGFPFSIFSQDDNSFSGVNEDCADLMANSIQAATLSPSRSHGQLIQQWFNTSAFGANQIGTFGNTGKNILRGPGLFNTDLALLKDTKVSERTSIQFRAEFFNVFNSVNFGMPDDGLTDSAFGQITSAGNPRILQFALKFMF
jgi:hypothetical protein